MQGTNPAHPAWRRPQIEDASHHEDHTAGTPLGPGHPNTPAQHNRQEWLPILKQQCAHAASTERLHHQRPRLLQPCWPSKPPNMCAKDRCVHS